MNKMRKIPVEELKPGMIFDKPVYIDSSNMLIASNIALNESDIKKVMTWGLTEVETSGELINARDFYSDEKNDDADLDLGKKIVIEYNKLLKNRKRLIEVYNSVKGCVEDVHLAIRGNKSFTSENLEQGVIDILRLLDENKNIFLFLYGLDEGRDYLLSHSVNVTFYSLVIGMAMGYTMPRLKDLGLGALLIDSGMAKMPAYIIHKQANLSDQELNQIKTHPLHGYRALLELGGIKENIALISLQHHESYDGKGYPRQLKGQNIDEFARIAAIADSYESQISNRSYRKKVDFYHAMRNLLASGVSRFDQAILKVFLSRMSVYPIGSLVELNDSSIGIVIGSIPEKPLRPIIKLIFDKFGSRIDRTIIQNLLDDMSVYIVKALDETEAGVNIFDVI